jgi:hypothetical protein
MEILKMRRHQAGHTWGKGILEKKDHTNILRQAGG